jgi:transcriptional regulator with XRE-family HTH domain
MITGRQIQAARALLGWSQEELGDRAQISNSALYRLERGRVDPRASTVEAVRRALERAGIEFFSDRDSEGLRLRRSKASLKEASATVEPKKR